MFLAQVINIFSKVHKDLLAYLADVVEVTETDKRCKLKSDLQVLSMVNGRDLAVTIAILTED